MIRPCKRMVATICAALSLGLAACTTVNVSPADATKTTAAQLSIDPSQIVYQHVGRFGSLAAGNARADFHLGWYVQTQDAVVLFEYSGNKAFTQIMSLPISEIDHIAIASTGMFNHLKQFQIFSRNMVIGINFTNSSDATSGSNEDTQPAYDALLKSGARVGEPVHIIIPSDTPRFIFVPIS